MEVVATGYKGRQNSLVYYCPPSPSQHVVFFQGDMQDTTANMMVHQAEVSPRQLVEVSRWSEWSLENTCSLLRHKFPSSSAVWLVRPCRMLRKLYSAFHNFVQSSMTGVPTYSSHHGALLHLHLLLADALSKVSGEAPMEMSVDEALHLPLVLAGFSKGCVVLNQITHELVNTVPGNHSERRTSGDHGNLEATPTQKRDGESEGPVGKPLPLSPVELRLLREVVSRIKALYWLDSGHSGEEGAWVTESEPLQSLARLQIPVHVDVTPQQVRDPTREWLGQEEAEFVSRLKQLGADVVETLHFEHEEKSLEYHFQVLREFKP